MDFSFIDGLVPTADSLNQLIRDQLIIICTSYSRPVSPSTYQRIYETDTGYEYIWNGSSWVLRNTMATAASWTGYTPKWFNSGTQPAIGNGTLGGTYRRMGKTLDITMYFYIGSTTTIGTGAWYFTLPDGMLMGTPGEGAGFSYVNSNYYPVVAFATSVVSPFDGVNYGVMMPYGPLNNTDFRVTYGQQSYPDTWGTGSFFLIGATLHLYG